MAFCTNCGTKLDEGAKFCPQCGTAQAADTVGAASPQGRYKPAQAPLRYQAPPVTPGRFITVIRVLSIIGFIWYPLMLFMPKMLGLNPSYDLTAYKGWGVLIYGYALSQAIVALVQARKHTIPVIKVMGIIAIVGCALAVMIINSAYAWEAQQGLFVTGLDIYALAFSITAFVKSKRTV